MLFLIVSVNLNSYLMFVLIFVLVLDVQLNTWWYFLVVILPKACLIRWRQSCYRHLTENLSVQYSRSDRSVFSGTYENRKSIYEAVVHLFFVDFLRRVCDSVFSVKVVTVSELQCFWFTACFNNLNPLLITFHSCFSLVLSFYFAYGSFLGSYNYHYPREAFCFLFSS